MFCVAIYGRFISPFWIINRQMSRSKGPRIYFLTGEGSQSTPKLASFRLCQLHKSRKDPKENKITTHTLQKCRKDPASKQRM
jgi:hypothetical protein